MIPKNRNNNHGVAPEKLNESESSAPSASPKSPQADFLGIVEKLERLTQVGEEELLNAEQIAEEVFLFLSDIPDQKVLKGMIDSVDDPDLKPYVTALNTLFPLVKNSETGGINQLNSNIVEKLSPKSYAKVAVIGGRPFVEVMCDIVNQEVDARTPSSNLFRVNAVRAFTSSNEVSIGR